jgi:hypothetical protein
MLGIISPSILDYVDVRVIQSNATICPGPNRPDRQRSIAAPERPFFRVSFDDVASVTYSFLQSDMSDPTDRGLDPGPGRRIGGLGGPWRHPRESRSAGRGSEAIRRGINIAGAVSQRHDQSPRCLSTPFMEDGPAWCLGTGI